MWDLLMEPAKVFLKGGVEAFRKSEEMKNVSVAVRDRLLREARFNSEVLQELVKERRQQPLTEGEERALVQSLRTQAFDDLNTGAIPLSLFFPETLDKHAWPAYLTNFSTYMGRLESIGTSKDLVERAYHRIAVAKTFASCGTVRADLKYLLFLMNALPVALSEK